MDAKIHVSRLGGTATVPPSKSAAHRAVLCAALAEGTSHITNIEYSKDIRATLGAAAQLGAKITEEAHSVTIKGHGTAGGFVTVTRPVFCNESGSTLRFMIPLFSLTAQKVRFTGAGRLFDRPQAIYQMLFERHGPMYYIKNGLDKKWHFLAYLFAAFGVLAVFGTGNATQVNTITTAIDSALSSFNILPADAVKLVNLIIGVALAIIIALILIGGIKRIGNVTSKLVPFMAIMYIVLALGVIFFHIKAVPAVFASIIEGAFHPASVTGGVVGSFFMSMKKGVSRGIFSNEAGLGTGSIAHACADTKKPVKQGFFGIFEVFVDTIIICTMTALVILCSGVSVNYGEAAGAELTISGFTAVYGSWVSIFTAVAMCCFAFSTIIGWGLGGGTRPACSRFRRGTGRSRPG